MDVDERYAPDRGAATLRFLIFAMTLLWSVDVIQGGQARPQPAPPRLDPDSRPPIAEVVGRTTQVSQPGTYVDHGAPLEDWELRRVERYVDVAARTPR